MESSINSLLGVKCPDSIIKPPEDTTYLTRDYEDKFTGQYFEHGHRVRSEEAFCGRTSLRTNYFMRLIGAPIKLNSYPWVSRYYTICVLSCLSSFGLLPKMQILQQMLFYDRQLLFFFHQIVSQFLFSLLCISNLLPNPIQSYIYFNA